MWTLFAAGYLLGLIGTAVVLRRERMVGAGPVVETTCSVFWPLYWGVLTFCSFRNRKRRAAD